MRRSFCQAAKRRREIVRHALHVGAAETEDFDRWLISWAQHNPRSKDPLGALMMAAERVLHLGDLCEEHHRRGSHGAALSQSRQRGALAWRHLCRPRAAGLHHNRLHRCQQAWSERTPKAARSAVPGRKAPREGRSTTLGISLGNSAMEGIGHEPQYLVSLEQSRKEG